MMWVSEEELKKSIVIHKCKFKKVFNLHYKGTEFDDSGYWWCIRILIVISLLIIYLMFSHRIIIFII